jgi:hypothetical protein
MVHCYTAKPELNQAVTIDHFTLQVHNKHVLSEYELEKTERKRNIPWVQVELAVLSSAPD